jgi:hypothetical protein
VAGGEHEINDFVYLFLRSTLCILSLRSFLGGLNLLFFVHGYGHQWLGHAGSERLA